MHPSSEQAKITAQIPASLATALRERAAAEDRSISAIVRMALKMMLAAGAGR